MLRSATRIDLRAVALESCGFAFYLGVPALEFGPLVLAAPQPVPSVPVVPHACAFVGRNGVLMALA